MIIAKNVDATMRETFSLEPGAMSKLQAEKHIPAIASFRARGVPPNRERDHRVALS